MTDLRQRKKQLLLVALLLSGIAVPARAHDPQPRRTESYGGLLVSGTAALVLPGDEERYGYLTFTLQRDAYIVDSADGVGTGAWYSAALSLSGRSVAGRMWRASRGVLPEEAIRISDDGSVEVHIPWIEPLGPAVIRTSVVQGEPWPVLSRYTWTGYWVPPDFHSWNRWVDSVGAHDGLVTAGTLGPYQLTAQLSPGGDPWPTLVAAAGWITVEVDYEPPPVFGVDPARLGRTWRTAGTSADSLRELDAPAWARAQASGW